jgi:hypothetical protein
MQHPQIDERSRALHRLVAEKIRRDPSLLASARATLARWRDPASPGRSEPYLAEWARLLDAGVEAALSALTEDSERADALRQCSPFTRVLTQAERYRFLKDWGAHHEAR